jgi:hypothetical protein
MLFSNLTVCIVPFGIDVNVNKFADLGRKEPEINEANGLRGPVFQYVQLFRCLRKGSDYHMPSSAINESFLKYSDI